MSGSTLLAVDLLNGIEFDLDPKRPKASLAEALGRRADSGSPMYRDTSTGTVKIGYVFGDDWYQLVWRTNEPWEVPS